MIPFAFVEELLRRLDIVDVVAKFVPLKQQGHNFVGLCPFHHEVSASFTVSPKKQRYHCFGCGAQGTAIGFYLKAKKMSYADAVRELAESVGLTVPDDGQGNLR